MRDDRERLLDILEAIRKIEKYAKQGKSKFEKNELIQNWIVHHLQIIGEAARALSSPFKSTHSDAPWAKIIGMRNILVHHYFGIDKDIVWTAVKNDLPDLKKIISLILKKHR